MSHHLPDSNGAPKRIAILSDVHGNLHAFQAVLDDIATQEVDAVWFLGDLVGYGAHPDECVALAIEKCDLCLAGNHDMGVAERIDISGFSPSAAAAARWTRANAGAETLQFLAGLEPMRSGEAIGLYHGSPRDPVWEYILSAAQAEECMEDMLERVSAIGHTHIALRFTLDNDELIGEQAPAGTVHDLSTGSWLVNPGSVGQPRDGDPRAAWMLIDTGPWTASWRRVEYPIEEAARAITDAGLPRNLADRLFIGQ
jgi:predicted phosphodiesterase